MTGADAGYSTGTKTAPPRWSRRRLWQSSWWESLPGLFVSPARGLDRPQIVYHLANFGAERARKKQEKSICLDYRGADPPTER